MIISEKLAEVLGAKVGDRLLIEVLEGERGSHEIPIHGLMTDYRGLNATMKIDALRRMLGEGETISGAHLRIDQGGDVPLRGKVVLVEPGAFLKVSALGVEEQRVKVRVSLLHLPENVLGDR